MSDIDTIEKLEQLTKALEAGKYDVKPATLLQGSVLKVEDLMSEYGALLTKEASQAMSIKCSSTYVKGWTPEDDKEVLFLSTVTDKSKGRCLAAIGELTGILNKLAAKNLIHGALAPLSALGLYSAQKDPETGHLFSVMDLSQTCDSCGFKKDIWLHARPEPKIDPCPDPKEPEQLEAIFAFVLVPVVKMKEAVALAGQFSTVEGQIGPRYSDVVARSYQRP